jgi:fucose 4-O-acetylase-like acetyltransferase
MNTGNQSSSSDSAARADWVDVAKGIGILLVVYGHVARGVFNAGIPMDESLYRIVDSVIYSFHMPLFFFIAGLFFSRSLCSAGPVGYLGSRAASLAYPYVVWSLLHGAIEVGMSGYTNGNVRWSDVLAFPLEPRAHFWFLYALVLVILTSVALHGAQRPSGARFTFALSFAALLHFVVDWLPWNRYVSMIADYLVFFWLGTAFAAFRVGRFLQNRRALILLLLLFVVLQTVLHSEQLIAPIWIDSIRFVTQITSIVFVVCCSFSIRGLAQRGLVALGAASMTIYLAHVLSGSGVRIVLSKLLGVEVLGMHLLLGVAAGVLFPLLIHRFQASFGLWWLFRPR